MKKTLIFSRKSILRIQKRQCLVVFLAFLLFSAAGIHAVSAASRYVQDADGQFGSDEEEHLEQECEAFREAHGFDIYILTVNSEEAGGSTEQDSRDYVEAFTDEHAPSGAVALLINMDIRYYYIDVTGDTPLAIYTDSRQQDLGDEVRSYLSSSDTDGAAEAFLSEAGAVASYAENHGDSESGEDGQNTVGIFVIPAVIAAIVSLIILGVMAGMHHQKKEARDASAYVTKNSVSFPVRQDVFISQYETRVPVAQDRNSSGGPHISTHTSSGGGTHSGSGGHF